MEHALFINSHCQFNTSSGPDRKANNLQFDTVPYTPQQALYVHDIYY